MMLCRLAWPALLVLANSPGNAASTDPAEEFRSTTQALADGITNGDKGIWDRTLAADCIITNEDGETFGKAKMLADIKPLPPGFTGQLKVRGLTVRQIGRSAVVHYWLDETEAVFGQQLRTTYVETDAYERSGNHWQVIAMQVTVVPRDLEPIEVDSSAWTSLVGEYSLDEKSTSRYSVFLREGRLYGGRDSPHATQLIPLAPLAFFQKGSIHIMIFVRDRQGVVTEVRELHKYNEVIMKRIAPAGSPPQKPKT
jgi:hypothetical protein